MKRGIVLAVLLGSFLPPLAWAAPKIALHVAPSNHPSPNHPCGTAVSDLPPCSLMNIHGDLGATGAGTFHDVYLIATQMDSAVSGASLGIVYNPSALQVLGQCTNGYYWSLEGPYGTWPAPWSGLRISGIPCHEERVPGYENQGIHTVLAALTIYANSSDIMYVTPNVQWSEFTLFDCAGDFTRLDPLDGGRAAFGDSVGFNPCSGEGVWTPTPVPPGTPTGPPAKPKTPPAVLLHVAPVTESACSNGPSDPNEIVTQASASPEGTPYHVYLIGAPEGADSPETVYGITGLQMAIRYDAHTRPGQGIQIMNWTRCSDLDFPGDTWPASESSNTITWSIDNCQQRQIVVAGYFDVVAYGPSALTIAPFPPSGMVKLARCGGVEVVSEIDPARIGWVSVGGAAQGFDTDGCNPLVEPCISVPTPTQTSTWGRMKNLYR